MALGRAFRLLFFGLLCFTCMVRCSTISAEALPSRVKVQLFSSREKDYRNIYVHGPVEILEPRNLKLGSDFFVAEPAAGGITFGEDIAGRPRHLLFTNDKIVLKAIGPTVKLSLNGAAARSYRGTVTLMRPSRESRLMVVNEVDTRSYITSCVGSESLPGFRKEALKAQAVLSTTLLERHYRGKPLLDSTEEQSYLGVSAERPDVKAAVDSVFGQQLYFNDKPIDIFFCSTCGGNTALPQIFGGKVAEGRYPYLKEVTCNFCKDSPFFKEHREEIGSMDFYKKTDLVNPRVIADKLGRPTRVEVTRNGYKSVRDGYQFWLLLGKSFGWGFVPSTRYSIELVPDAIKFTSRGCGHGVGMCQWGANGQAKAGRGYKEILNFYFPGTRLKNPSR